MSLTCLSVFSGAGGLDWGFKAAGFNIVQASDLDADAVLSYNLNFGEGSAIVSNIKDYHYNKHVNILLGGPPCQGLTRRNYRRSIFDERNTLYLDYIRVLNECTADYFVMENVIGLRDFPLYEEGILGEFKLNGYSPDVLEVNMLNYGVPQERKRLIFYGTREGKKKLKLEPFNKFGEDGEHKLNFRILCDGLDKYASTLQDIPNEFYQHNTFEDIADMEGKNRTITADAGLSVELMAKLQTFSERFGFIGLEKSVRKQIANAVPPLFAFQLALQIKRLVLD